MKLNSIRLPTLIATIFVSLIGTHSSLAMENKNIEEKWKSIKIYLTNNTNKSLESTNPRSNYVRDIRKSDSKPIIFSRDKTDSALFSPNPNATKDGFPLISLYRITYTDYSRYPTIILNKGNITFLFNTQQVRVKLDFDSFHKVFDFSFDDLSNLDLIVILAGNNFEDSTVQVNINQAAQLRPERLKIEQQRLEGRPETTIEKLLELKRK